MIRAVCTKFSRDKLKKKYHTVGTIPKSNWKIVDTDAKSMHITHIYMTAQFPGLVYTTVSYFMLYADYQYSASNVLFNSAKQKQNILKALSQCPLRWSRHINFTEILKRQIIAMHYHAALTKWSNNHMFRPFLWKNFTKPGNWAVM
jgi:hypothetical protein